MKNPAFPFHPRLARLLATVLFLWSSGFLRAGDQIPVYGQPGDGRIKVEVLNGFEKPGFYWLPADTKLPALVDKIGVKFDFQSDPPGFIFGVRVVRMNADKTEKKVFWMKAKHEFEDPKADSFALRDGDVIRPSMIGFPP